MKHLLTFFCVLAALACASRAADRLEKPALLVLPDTVPMHDGISALVEFRWDEETPVTLDTWSLRGELSTYGELAVFDDSGRKVEMFFPVSMPLVPSGTRTVEKGEMLKIALYNMGSVRFQHTGRYYAIATFSSAFAGKTNVRFTTKKRWFTVIDAKPKTT